MASREYKVGDHKRATGVRVSMGGPGGGPGRMIVGEKAKDPRKTIRKLITYLRPYYTQIIIGLLRDAVNTRGR